MTTERADRVSRPQPPAGRCRGLATAVLAATMLAACGGEADTGATPGDSRRILRVAYEREIDVLNPFTSQNLADIAFSMIEGLVTTDENNTYIPVLATTIPTEDNGLVVRRDDGTIEMTWPLQQGVRWHDGEPFTSADVCFTWRFVRDPRSQTYNREQYLGIVDCATPDEHTAVFTWSAPYAYYAGIFEAVLPEHVLGNLSAEEIVNHEPYNRGSTTIGTGPFRFAEWRAGEYIRVVRNDDYWRDDDAPGIDEIVWSFIPDSNTRLNALRSGQYDFARIEPRQVQQVRDLADYETHLIDSNSIMHLDLSVSTPHGEALFADPRVRRAIFGAIDRQAIADQLMQGTVRVADSPINRNSPYFNADIEGYAFDPEASGRLLDEAGWRPGPDGIRVRDDERLAFVVLNRAGNADRNAIAMVIQAQLRQIGVEVSFETLESAAWTQRWRNGRWEAIVSAWFLPADPSLTNLYACDGANNMTGTCDPDLDRILKDSDLLLDLASRRPLLLNAQQRLIDTARFLPLYYNVVPELVHRRVDGYRGSGTNFGSFWNLHEWTLTAPDSGP